MSETDTDIAEENTGFLNRWSQRKHQQSEDDKQKQQALDAKDEVIQQEEEVLKTDADMPPLENLTEDSDYSGFLSPKVSEVLRRQALRKLFHMPSLNVVDGLDDYADDFTSFSPLGDLVTEEMKRVFAREKEKLEREKQEKEKLEKDEAEKKLTAEQAEECTEELDTADIETELDTEDEMLYSEEAEDFLVEEQLADKHNS